MQYLRTRQRDRAGGRVRQGQSSAAGSVPDELANSVEQNPDHYFGVWLNSGRDWGKVLFKEKQRQEWEEEVNQDKEWK